MKLTFENANGKESVIGHPNDEGEAMKIITDFCTERGFEVYYIRKWAEGARRKYDVGSWYEFFYLEFPSEEEARVV